MTVTELRNTARAFDLPTTGTRAQLVQRLQEPMDRRLNRAWEDPEGKWAPSRLKVAELRDLLEERDMDTTGNRQALIARLRPIMDEEQREKEDNPPPLQDFFYPDQLLKYYKPQGRRVDQDSGYEQTEKEWLVNRLIRPTYKNGERAFVVSWIGYREPTVEPLAQLQEDVPRIVDLFMKRNDVRWNDRTKKATIN